MSPREREESDYGYQQQYGSRIPPKREDKEDLSDKERERVKKWEEEEQNKER